LASAGEVQALFETMEAEARNELGKEGIAPERIQYERSLDLRYSIQKYELAVPVGGGALKDADKAGWRQRFHELHEQHYGSRAVDQKVEIVNFRLTAKVVLPKPRLPEFPLSGEDPKGALKGRRRVYFDGWLDCPVYERERLKCGNRLAGPAIIEQVDSTIVMQPGHKARVDAYGNMILEVMGERK
jgi:N-methylhydantoinase A